MIVNQAGAGVSVKHVGPGSALAACLTVLWAVQLASAQVDGQLLGKEEAAFRRAVEIAAPCVVQIETFGGLERVGEELVAEGPTTGTILDGDGWIVSTLYSFRQQPASILVTLPDGKLAAAKVVARDFSRELALLKADVDAPLPVASAADPSTVMVGSWTIALGKTYDKSQVSPSVGIISALGRAYGKAVQTDAKISPSNYGGPLIDLQGRVIGILAPISPGTFFEGDSSELYDSGVGFAIPIGDILARLPGLQSGQDVYPGKLGIVSSNQNEMAGPVRLSGAAPGSPAAKAGVKARDVMIEAGGQPINLLAELRHALAEVDAGQTFHFAVRRAGQRIDMTCELAKEIPIYRRRYLGLRLADGEQGVTIVGIEPNSPAAKHADIDVGDRIVSCNGQAVQAQQELVGQLAVAELDTPLQLTLADPAGKAKHVAIVAETWPEALPAALPPTDAGIDESLQVDIAEVTLGDVPNKAYAIVPPQPTPRSLGLLILFPEPGQLDKEKTKTHWQAFCRDQGWLVVVINSANPRVWSMDEIELAGRVMGRMEKTYKIDKSRCVIGGLGVGGRVALAAAAMERQRVNGVLTLGTMLDRMALRQRNAPLQSLDFLFVGDPQKLAGPAAQLSESGYAANVVPSSDIDTSKWETVPMEPVTRWLEGLGRL